MANKKVTKRSVIKSVFVTYLHERGTNVAQLANAVGVHDRTITRGLSNGYFSFDLAMDIAKYLNADFDTMFGPDLSGDWGAFVIAVRNYVR